MRKNGDILIAWVLGNDVQFLNQNTGNWCDWTGDTPPHVADGDDWRIKPEKKPDVVRYLRASPDTWAGRASNKAEDDNNLRLTFSGETGELIKAEVLK